MSLIVSIVEHPGKIRPQRFNVRLHSHPGSSLRPEQSFSKLRRTRGLSLGPDDQGLAQSFLPLTKGSPDVPIRRAQRLRRVTDRAAFEHGRQQLEKWVSERRSLLFAGLKRIAQVQPQLGLANWGRCGPRFSVCGLHPRILAPSRVAHSSHYQGLQKVRLWRGGARGMLKTPTSMP